MEERQVSFRVSLVRLHPSQWWSGAKAAALVSGVASGGQRLSLQGSETWGWEIKSKGTGSLGDAGLESVISPTCTI
jgi:hypothetical protein